MISRKNLGEAPGESRNTARGDGATEMEQRIQALDWAKTPLGPSTQWPQSLRTVVNILLSSRYAMWMAWGRELTMLYNDAYRPTLGIKHPWALGQPASSVWAEIWPDIGPRIEAVLATGRATYDEGLLLFLERSGFPEETYHTFSYSPLLNDEAQISGMLCVVTEETDRVIGERRVQTLRELSAALASTNTEEQVLQAFGGQLNLNKKDLPFTLTYLFDEAGHARLASASGITAGHPAAPAWISRGSDTPWPVHQVRVHPSSRLIDHLAKQSKMVTLPAGDWNKPAQHAAVVPIKQQGQEQPAGVFIVGTNPYRRYDSAYSGFITLLSGQLAAGLGNARAYEAERRRAEALAEIDRAKTTFFSNVSHELRTPLTLMLSPIEELLANKPDRMDREERHLLNLVHRNGLRLQKLVNTLLDFSRIEAGRMQATYEATDLAHYTKDLVSNFRSALERAGLRLRVDCEPLSQPVYIDREMWEKIVLNLLSNALKFTFEGGVTVSLQESSQAVALTVEDTGIGIAPAELPRIFERFHRAAGAKGRTIEGTGIGLALVQELVKLHAGTITVKSEIGKGSSFTVSIPKGVEHLPAEKVTQRVDGSGGTARADLFVTEALRWLPDDPSAYGNDPSSGSLAPSAAPLPSIHRERVLLADDNADVREYVARLLGRQYAVIAVSNGADALARALAEPPDLILSDIMMPELDGFKLLEELRAHPETSTIPVILLSARAGEESQVEGLGAGADDYLVKPFTARELLARVGAHVSMSRRRKEAERELRETQGTLQSFYDSCPFLMGVAEIEGEEVVQLYSNSATATFFGLVEPEILNRSGKDLGVPTEITRLWLERYRESQAEARSVRFEYEHPRPEGDCWLSACVNFLGFGSGGRPRFSFIAEDVTERKKNEELLRQSNIELRRANSDLEQFAYSASHDLKEPLRQVAVYSQLLEKKFASKLDGKAAQYLAYCIEGAHRMEMLISDLLAYSQATKTSEASSEEVNMNEVVDTAIKNLATSIDETAAEILTAELPVVRANSVPLVHLFQNLISNALKYRSKQTPRVQISAREDGDEWLFSVQDNGIGIPKEFQTQIFGIFKRLHNRSEYPGTGIGLAICQKVVEQYGGRIWVESEPGGGSTFVFTLPRDDK
jgi:signal transduction histidine kinase/CheY-like chemotaxis protein